MTTNTRFLQVSDLFDSPQTILSTHADREAVDSFLAYRKKHKRAALTDRGARMLAKSLAEINEQGGDATEALDIAQEMGWQSIKPEWYWRNKEGSNGQHNRVAGGGGSNSNAGANQVDVAARAYRTPSKDMF